MMPGGSACFECMGDFSGCERLATLSATTHQRFTSIEVDPWLVEGELLVAHDDANIMLGITLELGASSCWLITREALRMMASVTAVQQYDALKHSLQKYPEEHPGLYTEWYGDGTSLTGAINVPASALVPGPVSQNISTSILTATQRAYVENFITESHDQESRVSRLAEAETQSLPRAPVSRGGQKVGEQKKRKLPAASHGPLIMVPRPLPSVLIIHTGGTLGMDPVASYEPDVDGREKLKRGGSFKGTLGPGDMLNDLLNVVPELNEFANLHLKVAFNKDSSRVGPKEWVQLAKLLHQNRKEHDAFLVVHGTDTMAYTASALSLMLLGFRKPIVMTGSQLPLAKPRSDARQNLIDAITCATAYFNPPHEVAVCFGGQLMRGNRAQKVNASNYQAFDSPTYHKLALLGVEVDWQTRYLLQVEGVYRPRFGLDPSVIRLPIVPGSDPRAAYGDLVERGVKGVVLEAFGVGNMPDLPQQGWLPWLRQQRKKGLQVYLSSQCTEGTLNPELYRSGQVALSMGVEAGPRMTPECAVVKMMQCLRYPDISLGVPLAGEM
ncbi:hypothetical protein ABBQ38_014253 [Trebouxia sp. C0009 RCD-2024]